MLCTPALELSQQDAVLPQATSAKQDWEWEGAGFLVEGEVRKIFLVETVK